MIEIEGELERGGEIEADVDDASVDRESKFKPSDPFGPSLVLYSNRLLNTFRASVWAFTFDGRFLLLFTIVSPDLLSLLVLLLQPVRSWSLHDSISSVCSTVSSST